MLTSHHPEWGNHAEQANNFDADLCIGIEIRNEGPTICHFLGDHFESPTGKIRELRSTVIEEIAAYYSKFQDRECSYIRRFPTSRDFQSWSVILKKQGFPTIPSISAHSSIDSAWTALQNIETNRNQNDFNIDEL